jgi:hypothetical protein
MDSETCIIVTGNPVGGAEFVGPFPNVAEASEYADRFVGCDYWIANIAPPAMETSASVNRKVASGEWESSGMAEHFMAAAEAILDSEDGIDSRAYAALVALAEQVSPDCARNLACRVDATDGRFYLPSAR